ncbi:MAG TPA: DUF3634 family protein [Polyangiaceae bacterium]
MPASIIVLTLIIVMAAIVWRARMHLRLFVIEVEAGAITALRGRIPRRLLTDISDVVRHERCQRLRIACRVDDGYARLEVIGDTHPGLEQALRNLVGEYPLARLKQSPRAKR